jgi:transcriptional regulator with XRE-family HTH domain
MGETGQGTLGVRLRGLRIGAGLTQGELAEYSGVSLRAISDIECGRTARPIDRSLSRIAITLRVSDSERDALFRLARSPRRNPPAFPPESSPWACARRRGARLFSEFPPYLSQH